MFAQMRDDRYVKNVLLRYMESPRATQRVRVEMSLRFFGGVWARRADAVARAVAVSLGNARCGWLPSFQQLLPAVATVLELTPQEVAHVSKRLDDASLLGVRENQPTRARVGRPRPGVVCQWQLTVDGFPAATDGVPARRGRGPHGSGLSGDRPHPCTAPPQCSFFLAV